jgi:hypothetical protein
MMQVDVGHARSALAHDHRRYAHVAVACARRATVPTHASASASAVPPRRQRSPPPRDSDAGASLEPLRVALVCGGPSPERGISLNSARSLLDHLGADPRVEVNPPRPLAPAAHCSAPCRP